MNKALYLILFLAATGCLSKKPLNKQAFAFNVPDTNPLAISTNAPILTIRELTVMPPFDSPSLTYRTGELSYERDPYAGFLVSPAAGLRGSTQALLRNTGKFFAIADTESALRDNLDVEISVTQLYGDFRDKGRPTAVLEMRFMLYNPSASRGAHFQRSNPTVLLQKTYIKRIPLKSRTAAAVVSSLNEALREIVSEFVRDVPVS